MPLCCLNRDDLGSLPQARHHRLVDRPFKAGGVEIPDLAEATEQTSDALSELKEQLRVEREATKSALQAAASLDRRVRALEARESDGSGS